MSDDDFMEVGKAKMDKNAKGEETSKSSMRLNVEKLMSELRPIDVTPAAANDLQFYQDTSFTSKNNAVFSVEQTQKNFSDSEEEEEGEQLVTLDLKNS